MKKFLKSTIIFSVCVLSFANVTFAKDFSEAEIKTELEKSGAEVFIAKTYKTESAAENFSSIAEEKIDLVTFTSSSTVENFVQAVGKDYLQNVKTAAIGTVTAQTLKNFGVTADIVAEKFTIAGLVDAIKNSSIFQR